LLALSVDVHADPASSHPADGGDLVRHPHRALDRDGEAQADAAARLGQYEGIHADDLAVGVDQRAARVTRVDRRVGLNHVDVDTALLGARQDVAPQRAHHTRRDARLGIAEQGTVGVADSDHPVADL
jgi:hypothetical protein